MPGIMPRRAASEAPHARRKLPTHIVFRLPQWRVYRFIWQVIKWRKYVWTVEYLLLFDESAGSCQWHSVFRLCARPAKNRTTMKECKNKLCLSKIYYLSWRKYICCQLVECFDTEKGMFIRKWGVHAAKRVHIFCIFCMFNISYMAYLTY
jgi:hypothetical protein